LSREEAMGIELEHVFDYEALLRPPVAIGKGPFGTRTFMEVAGGEIRGERVRGKVLSGGGDWALIGEDGWTRLDVRGQFETDDGALVYMAYPGVMELNQELARALASGQETEFQAHYFRTTPTFETGDERYRWLTRGVFVARGRACPGGVAYEVYRAC
jgi:hypothetical protein